jgi:DNA-binding NtrC family response regulator
VRRVGENLPRRVDARIVAATNRRLAAEVERGTFRQDLRYRLDVLHIAVPPLRERREDIPLLVAHLWRGLAARAGSDAALSVELVDALARHDWPGNVRELQNVLATLAVHAPRRGRLHAAVLPRLLGIAGTGAAPATLDEARRQFEVQFVRETLARYGGRRTDAARALGLSRQGLAKTLVRLGLSAQPMFTDRA